MCVASSSLRHGVFPCLPQPFWVPLTQTQNESDEIDQGDSPTCRRCSQVCHWKYAQLATQGTESSSYLKKERIMKPPNIYMIHPWSLTGNLQQKHPQIPKFKGDLLLETIFWFQVCHVKLWGCTVLSEVGSFWIHNPPIWKLLIKSINYLHPWKLTWKPKSGSLVRCFVLLIQGTIFQLPAVSFQGCTSNL